MSEADVLHVAQLARLVIDTGRLPSLVDELNGILQHIDALQNVVMLDDGHDEGKEGMPLRDDATAPVALERRREQFAPMTRDGFFLVPRLTTHGDAGASAGEEQS